MKQGYNFAFGNSYEASIKLNSNFFLDFLSPKNKSNKQSINA